MPYEISFTKPVAVSDTSHYFNECCFGGDLVSEQLLPAIRERYEDWKRHGNIQANQEDWGWFIWFDDRDDRKVGLAVDVFCDDPKTGAFRIRLTSRKKRFWFSSTIVDTAELECLREIVVERIGQWVGAAPGVEHVDD
jgi:hypothetical protein